MAINSYRDLQVWRKAMEVARDVYRLTAAFPKREQYGLSSQMQRAAVSVPANIAEGHARESTKEYLHHLSIARGSLAELETLLLLASDFQYCDPDERESLLGTSAEINRMLIGLRNRLKQRLNETS